MGETLEVTVPEEFRGLKVITPPEKQFDADAIVFHTRCLLVSDSPGEFILTPGGMDPNREALRKIALDAISMGGQAEWLKS